MNKRLLAFACTLVSGALLTGCADSNGNGGIDKTTGGALLGAGAGAALGGLFSHGSTGAIVAGGLAGGLLGGVIGHEMDERDRAARAAALQQALQTSQDNRPKQWHNTQTGNSGAIKPLNGYTKSANAQTCRQFSETYTKEGKTYEQTSRACRDANGEWKLANQ
ncbi:MAG TPA: RT0821/Lpp0805 family surface protein [Paraburkholderia sp.]|nr:RT0821/Lpp0805 family surface protein [Paraburkholderia sp.]